MPQPGIKILQFLKAAVPENNANDGDVVEAGGFPTFSVAELLRLSVSAINLDPLDKTYAVAWVDYWKRIGYINA